MNKFKVIGHFKLSAKALKHEAKAFEKFTGMPAEKIRVVVLRLADDTKWHHFFYYNRDTRVVDPYPEYRRLDSFLPRTMNAHPFSSTARISIKRLINSDAPD